MLSPSRAAAFDILLRVEQREAYASELLHSHRLDALSVADRALCTEIVMGVLRWQSLLDARIAHLSFTPFRKLDAEVVIALRIGAYQLMFLERIPARAAVDESVELVKRSRKASAAALANAVLRKMNTTVAKQGAAGRRRSAVQHDLGRHSLTASGERVAQASRPGESARDESAALAPEVLARDFAHPAWLVERWTQQYGADAATAICAYDQQIPPTFLRLPPRADPDALGAELLAEGVSMVAGSLLASARRILSGDVTRTRAFRDGHIRIQDEGSQLVAALVGRGERILDCCAAPGGKTAALADRNPGARIVAVDLHPHRARLLRQLVAHHRVAVLAADALSLPLAADFDRVLADVPCSGTGTLARNPEIKWRLAPADLADLHARQLAILRGALERLAPAGRLVYSTCSLEAEECEAVVEEVVARAPDLRVIPVGDELAHLRAAGELLCDPATLTRGPYLRTVPGIHACDGFFAAIMENQRQG